MNILFTTSQGDVAGSTNSMYYLSRELAKRGHKVFMACRPESLIFQMLQDTGVELVTMNYNGKFDLKAAKKIKELVISKNIELINSQSGRDRYAVIWSRIFYGNNCIHINTRRQRPLSDGGVLINRFITKYTDKVVAVSHSIKDSLARIGYREDHVEVIHNGTPKEKYKLTDKIISQKLKDELGIDGQMPVLGSVSRPKNHDQLLTALGMLERKVKLILVGIEETEEYRKIIESYPIAHEVHFLSTVTNEIALDYLALFDIMVLPSTNEGISQSILEALAMGIPVIATNASGNPELIKEGENGILFEDGDTQGLADSIMQLLINQDLRSSYSEAGRKTAFEEFSIEKTVDKYESLFEALLVADP